MLFYHGEIEDIGIAAILLALAFTFAINGLTEAALRAYPYAFLLVVPAFILHELMHKAVAQHFGIPARFLLFKEGLLLALLLSPTGFLFAAPGAVFIFSRTISKDKLLWIASAGPIANIVLALLGFLLPQPLSAQFVAINAFLALFNLLPFGPLDGAKIYPVNKKLWAALILLSAALLI